MPNKTAAPKTSLMTGLLLVSIIANLFLVGVVASSRCSTQHKFFGPMALATPHGEYMAEWMERYLDATDAAAFREAFEPQATPLKQAHEAVRLAVEEAAAAFEKDPADPDALHAALNRLAQAKGEVHEVIAKIMQDADTKLSPEGRRRLADLTR
jgi:uncharacterized membrane protein